MKSTPNFYFVSLVLFCFIVAGCGTVEGSENQRIFMGEVASQASPSQSQQNSPPPSSIDIEVLFRETGIYPTERKIYQDGYTEVTVNGIKLMRTDGEYWIAGPSVQMDDDDYEDLLAASNPLKKRLIKRDQDRMGL